MIETAWAMYNYGHADLRSLLRALSVGGPGSKDLHPYAEDVPGIATTTTWIRRRKPHLQSSADDVPGVKEKRRMRRTRPKMGVIYNGAWAIRTDVVAVVVVVDLDRGRR